VPLVEKLVDQRVCKHVVGIPLRSEIGEVLKCAGIHRPNLISSHGEVLSPVGAAAETLHQGFESLEDLGCVVLGICADITNIAALRRAEQRIVRGNEAHLYRKGGVEFSFIHELLESNQRLARFADRDRVLAFPMQDRNERQREYLNIVCDEAGKQNLIIRIGRQRMPWAKCLQRSARICFS